MPVANSPVMSIVFLRLLEAPPDPRATQQVRRGRRGCQDPGQLATLRLGEETFAGSAAGGYLEVSPQGLLGQRAQSRGSFTDGSSQQLSCLQAVVSSECEVPLSLR